MRQRLTRDGLFRRTAAPDAFSGRNPNTPINLYDIKPNARFPVGSKVTFVDSEWLKVRGTVLGHAAEDRLWVQMPNEVIQADVEDVVGLDEVTERVEMRSPGYIESSRRQRNAAFFTLDDLKSGESKDATVIDFDEESQGDREAWRGVDDEYADEDGDLEFIPDEPDFIDGEPVEPDGHPTNEIHTGELPSEQDPRDKIDEEDNDQSECPEHVEVIMSAEPGDVTDLIENWIKSARNGEGTSRIAQNRMQQWWQQRQQQKQQRQQQAQDEQTRQRIIQQHGGKEGKESEAVLNYNLFRDDPGVIAFLKQHGLSDPEIENFADIRQHSLDRYRQRYEKHQAAGAPMNTVPNMKFGAGAGTTYTVRPKGQPTQKSFQPPKPPPVPSWQQSTPVGEEGYGLAASVRSSLDRLRRRANLIGNRLAMPNTAAHIYQAADLVSAIYEFDNGGPLDEVTKSALRNTSRDLLLATDHLKSVDHRIANRVAGEIEQLYVDSLSN